MTTIVVTHNPDLAARCDRLFTMSLEGISPSRVCQSEDESGDPAPWPHCSTPMAPELAPHVREVQREGAPRALLRPLRGLQARLPGDRVRAPAARHPARGRGDHQGDLPPLQRQARGRPPRDRGRAHLRRAHLLDGRAAALRGVEEDPGLRLARGRVDAAPLRRHGAPAHRHAAGRGLRGRAHPHGARLRRLRRARGDDLAHQGARGLQAEEGAPVPRRVQPRPDAAGAGPAIFDPLIGREKEVERIIQILSRRTKNNPILLGEPGVGKTAIVEGLAHADRRGRGADFPGLQEDPRPGPLADRRRHQVPRPVRGAPEGDHPRAAREPGPHHLHRRDPLPDRRRLGRGLARRGQHPEAGPLARRGLLHRRDDAQGVPQVHREGPQPAAALPGDPRDRALGERDLRDPRGRQGPLRAVPQGALLGRGDQDRGLPVQPLHHRPVLPRQGHRHPRRGGREGEAAPRAPTRRTCASSRSRSARSSRR